MATLMPAPINRISDNCIQLHYICNHIDWRELDLVNFRRSAVKTRPRPLPRWRIDSIQIFSSLPFRRPFHSPPPWRMTKLLSVGQQLESNQPRSSFALFFHSPGCCTAAVVPPVNDSFMQLDVKERSIRSYQPVGASESFP